MMTVNHQQVNAKCMNAASLINITILKNIHAMQDTNHTVCSTHHLTDIIDCNNTQLMTIKD